MICKNCGHTVRGKFCNQCGQRTDTGRINLDSILRDISEGVFQVEKGLFFTVKEMTLRPGHALHDYLDGKRKRHMRPFAYIVLLSTIYYLVALMAGQNTWIDDLISGFMLGAKEKDSEAEIPHMVSWLTDNYAYLTLILLPVFSLGSYLAFKRFGKNYFEHVVINSFITGHQAIIYSLFTILSFLIYSDVVQASSFFFSVFYTFWVYWHLFSKGSRTGNVLRSLASYILYFVFTIILVLAAYALSLLF